MEKEDAKLRLWTNAAKVKTKTRSVMVQELKNSEDLVIQFKVLDKKDAHKPACEHVCLRGKVRQTTLKLSPAGLDALLLTLMEYKKMKYQQLKTKTNERNKKA